MMKMNTFSRVLSAIGLESRHYVKSCFVLFPVMLTMERFYLLAIWDFMIIDRTLKRYILIQFIRFLLGSIN